jgi:DNA-binding transcriptional LysR family regulator
MDLEQLRCFAMAADELHFGRAAQRLGVLPAAFSRSIRLLEESLGAPLFVRTTRHVALTADGAALLDEARDLVERADRLMSNFQARSRDRGRALRMGAIDTASAGLLPALMHDLRERCPDLTLHLVEDKTARLLPRLVSGRLDLVFVRPPEAADKRIEYLFLLHETPVVALPSHHPLAARSHVAIEDLAHEPLIVPDRKSRPHSHDVTMKLFKEAGLTPNIIQQVDEKQTIAGMVAADMGAAIVPRWTSRMSTRGVKFIPIRRSKSAQPTDLLPLAAAWIKGLRDPARDHAIELLRKRLAVYAKGA